MAGMPASNTGAGATKVSLGSGSPTSTNMAGNGAHAVTGVKLGVAGGTGPLNSTGKIAGPVNLGQNTAARHAEARRPDDHRRSHRRPRSSSNHARSTLKRRSSSISREPSPFACVSPPPVPFRYSASPAASAMVSTNPPALPSRQPASSPQPTPPELPIDWEGVVNVAFQLAG